MSGISREALFGKLNPIAYQSVESATVFCKMRGNPYVELVHWVSQLVQAPFEPPAQVSTIDGLRVDWPDGFGLIRASNTTPVLVLRFEGHTQEAMHRIERTMLGLLRTVKPDASIAKASH